MRAKRKNEMGGKGGGVLYANFSVGITDGTLNVVGGIYFRRSFQQEINWNAHQKFQKCRLLFLSVGNCAAGNSVGNSASDRRALLDVISIGDCRLWFRWKLWHKPIIFFQLSVKYRRHYSVGVPVGETVNIYAASTWIFVYPPAHLDHTQHNNRSWQLKKNKYFMFQNITL